MGVPSLADKRYFLSQMSRDASWNEMLRASRVSSFTAVLIAATRLRFFCRFVVWTPPGLAPQDPSDEGRDGPGRPSSSGLARIAPPSPAEASCQTQHVGSGRQGYAPAHPPSTAFSAAPQHRIIYIFQCFNEAPRRAVTMPEMSAESSVDLRRPHNILCPRAHHRKSTACAPALHMGPGTPRRGAPGELLRRPPSLTPETPAPGRGRGAGC